MAGPSEKFQVVKRHEVTFSQNLRAITAHQLLNVGTLLLPNTKNRNTHGLDCFISYHSQLHARVLDHLVISSKYTSVPYPDNPTSAFKGHFRDLAHTLECFKLSGVRQAANKSFSNVDMARDIGVCESACNNDPL
jgi:hypothetical protein